MEGEDKPSKPKRKATERLLVMLTVEEDKAFRDMCKRESLDRTALTKYALYRFSQDMGYRFPWDERYQVLSLRHKKK